MSVLFPPDEIKVNRFFDKTIHQIPENLVGQVFETRLILCTLGVFDNVVVCIAGLSKCW